jgi:hypothetical protein
MPTDQTMNTEEHPQTKRENDPDVLRGASIEDLGLEVVENADAQITLARPVRHIRATP